MAGEAGGESIQKPEGLSAYVPLGGVHFSELGSIVLLPLPLLISFAFHSSIRSYMEQKSSI